MANWLSWSHAGAVALGWVSAAALLTLVVPPDPVLVPPQDSSPPQRMLLKGVEAEKEVVPSFRPLEAEKVVVPSFRALALETGTDKVSPDEIPYGTGARHHYDVAYEKYLPKIRAKPGKIKFLEIGLGCMMTYGPGASYKLWKRYWGEKAQVHFLEYDAKCVEAWRDKVPGATIHVGDQADPAVLERLLKDADGQFDIIVDDGGHTCPQQKVSFQVLFDKGLKPGGIYFLEDLQTSYLEGYGGGYLNPNSTIEQLKRFLDIVNFQKVNYLVEADKRIQPEPPGSMILSMDCFTEICVFTKKSDR